MDLYSLMAELKKGNRHALTPIYVETKRAVFSVAYSILKSAFLAQDIMQETYIRVCEKISAYKENVSPRAWICTIARNLAIDEYRKEKRSAPFNEAFMQYAPNEQNFDLNEEAGELLKLAKATLNGLEYEILFMHTIGGLRHKEIADVLKKPYATVRWNYAQAINKMKNRLKASEV